MANGKEYVGLGIACADVCRALDRGLNCRQADQSNRPVFEAIEQLTTWVELVEMLTSPTYLLRPRSQDCGTNSNGCRQAEQKQPHLQTFPREGH